MEQKTVRLAFNIDPDLKKRFKIYCVENGIDMTTLLTEFIKKKIENQKGGDKHQSK
jgi:antitoxin component of RelBE/YafQ-DinJ toxin-antitoxin module